MKKTTATILLLLASLFWGTCYIAIKMGLLYFPPFYFVGVRFIFASILLFLLFWKSIKRTMSKQTIKSAFILSIFLTSAFMASTAGVKYTTATNAAFLTCISAIFTPMIAYFLFRRKITKTTFISVVLVTIGLYLLCSGNGSFSLNFGDIICLLASVLFALQFAFTEKHIISLDPICFTALQFMFCGIISMTFSFLFETPPDLATIPINAYLPVLYTIILGSCATYVIQNICQKHVNASYVSIVFSAEPLFGAIFSYLILGETLGPMGILGGLLILVSILYASRD